MEITLLHLAVPHKSAPSLAVMSLGAQRLVRPVPMNPVRLTLRM